MRRNGFVDLVPPFLLLSSRLLTPAHFSSLLQLKEHPWPGLSYDDEPGRTRHLSRCLTGFQLVCGRAGAVEWDEEDEEDELQREREGSSERREFRWTQQLKVDFWEELQKLVCLDFIMRNTDRGT